MFTWNTINLGYERQFKSTWYRNFNVSFKCHSELFISETPEVHTDWVREKRRLKGSQKTRLFKQQRPYERWSY